MLRFSLWRTDFDDPSCNIWANTQTLHSCLTILTSLMRLFWIKQLTWRLSLPAYKNSLYWFWMLRSQTTDYIVNFLSAIVMQILKYHHLLSNFRLKHAVDWCNYILIVSDLDKTKHSCFLHLIEYCQINISHCWSLPTHASSRTRAWQTLLCSKTLFSGLSFWSYSWGEVSSPSRLVFP